MDGLDGSCICTLSVKKKSATIQNHPTTANTTVSHDFQVCVIKIRDTGTKGGKKKCQA